MRQISTIIFTLLSVTAMMAQGWPSQYKGVMLQGFYWDSYTDTQWANLESQADELAEFFNLIWIPQSGKSANYPNNSMGYDDLYWFTDYTSSFGNEDQLRSMISTFKAKGLGTIADVVINHRASLADTWMSFPVETYNGITYEMLPSDICANDDNGKAAANAEIKPTGANDSGDDFDGARDIDHSSQNVQTMVKAYLDMLLNDFGYTGFRYDMVKGYAPKYTGMYNTDANPEYSVGEYWDGNASSVINWIDGTKVNGVIQSAAFDFPLKYHLRDCCNAGTNWNRLENASLAGNTTYSRYAVTFVDNHDTYGRGNDGEIKNNILAANAFILAAPGTPCVFLPHWKEYKQEIKNLIEARKLAGITNMSDYKNVLSHRMYLQNEVTGEHGKLLVYLGTQNQSVDKAQWVKLAGDNTYSYWLSRDTETAWADKASGTYANAVEVTLSAISTSDNAQVVYTLDGSEPTANSTAVASGTKLPIDETCTLTYGLLKDGKVTGISSRQYTIEGFSPHTATIYLKDPNWTNVYFYAWDEEGDLLKAWPGTEITATKEIDDERWYYHTFDINEYGYTFNIIFNQGKDKMQTVDIGPLSEDTYFEIGEVAGGKYTVNNVSGGVTGIESVTADDNRSKDTHYYDLNGYKTDKPQKKGIYIHQGKKIVVR